ncbi:MAG: PEP-CTERM sorting domain-containing protein [Planctomycetota bacterium]
MRKTNLFAAAIAATAMTSAASAQVLINEFEPNQVGADAATQVIELLGTPGETFDGFLISIESDPGAPGVISNSGPDDDIEPISGTFDANGLLLVEIGDLENPSFTLLLTDTFTGFNEDGGSATDPAAGGVPTDIDTDDDGFVDDLSAFGTIFDAIGISDADDEPVYGAELGGVDFAFTGDEPGLVFRDGANPSTILAVNDPAGELIFDQDGNTFEIASLGFDPVTPTFGEVNPSVGVIPEPASLGLLGVAGLGLLRRRSA